MSTTRTVVKEKAQLHDLENSTGRKENVCVQVPLRRVEALREKVLIVNRKKS